jgi:hypothetical protein
LDTGFTEDDYNALRKILGNWQDGDLTDDELISGLGVSIVSGLREGANQWINGDISDNDLLSRVLLASDVLLGNRKDLMK